VGCEDDSPLPHALLTQLLRTDDMAGDIDLEPSIAHAPATGGRGEIVDGAPLSEVWYSGLLGGVPAGT